MDVLSRWKQNLTAGLHLTAGLRVGLICVTALGLLSVRHAAWAQEAASIEQTSPYVVFVAEEDACARCGPGEHHYKTDPLRRGQELEVYVETDDGWLGVRPPEGSFCWLPADSVEPSTDRTTGVIRKDSVIAWIGTHLGQARRYRWQVELERGEQVSVIGTSERKNGEGESKTWLRIVPPSGEFRWIHHDQIAESAEQLAEHIASSVVRPIRRPEVEVATVSLEQKPRSPEPAVIQKSDSDDLDSVGSTRRSVTSANLKAADESDVSKLMPAPAARNSTASRESTTTSPRAVVNDSAFQIHGDANPDDYEDSGAVIGSGLKEQWNEDAGQSVLAAGAGEELPANGAAAAAAAITDPIRRMTDVVANFISPPRLVEINPTATYNAMAQSSAADRRWSVGTPYTGTNTPPGLGIAQSGVVQTGGVAASADAGRVVTVGQITRVENAVANADLDALGRALSRLIAEGASADEINPVIRRADTLLRSNEVAQAGRTRELLDRAQRYRSLAVRRDGQTTIQSENLSSNVPPLLPETLLPAPPTPVPPTATSSAQAAGATIGETPATAIASRSTEPSVQPAAWRGTQRNHAAAEQAAAEQALHTPLGPVTGTATGYLVQVYSSRPNSPPFALTDDAGLTIAYVTPYPGVNLRNHLNSRIAVRGTEKMLEGMSTPHLLVDQALRR